MSVLWLFVACTPEETTGSFTADLPASTSKIGVALNVSDVVVLVVGESATLPTESRFFEAPRSDADDFEAETDEWLLVGRFEDGIIRGTLTDPDGGATPFDATPPTVPESGDGVWWAAEGEGACRAGGLLYNAAFQLQGFYCPAAGEYVALSPVDLTPEDGTIGASALVDGAEVALDLTPALKPVVE